MTIFSAIAMGKKMSWETLEMPITLPEKDYECETRSIPIKK